MNQHENKLSVAAGPAQEGVGAVSVEMAQALIQAGNLEAAITVLEQVHEKEPSVVEPVLLRAEVARALNDPTQECVALEQLIALAPYFDPAHLRLASLQEQAGHLEEAEATYERLNERTRCLGPDAVAVT